MDKSSKKRIIAITIVAILLVGTIAMFSYALWTRSFKQDTTNVSTAGCFDVEYEYGDGINLENTYPMTDEEGLETNPYTVTIKNMCTTTVEYSVVLNEATSNTLADSYVKYSINGNTPQVLSGMPQGQSSVSGYDETRTLKTGTILPKGLEQINTRIWLKEEATQDEVKDTTFVSKITLSSKATKTTNMLAAKILSNNPIQDSTKIDFMYGSPVIYADNGKGLFAVPDDDGMSYYFRGAVENNIVEFAEMKWKIVRINGDGSIRLTIGTPFGVEVGTGGVSSFNEVKDANKYVGYTYENSHNCTKSNPCVSDYDSNKSTFTYNYKNTNTKDSTIKTYLENWYITNLANYDDKIALATYCNDTSITSISNSDVDYGAYDRNSMVGYEPVYPILTCPDPTDYQSTVTHNYGGVYKLKIGLITTDETIMAGLPASDTAEEPYNYLYYYGIPTDENGAMWIRGSWSMTPAYFYSSVSRAQVFLGNITGSNPFSSVSEKWAIFPVINLKPDVKFTLEGRGDPGTEGNPYIIK